MEETIYYSENTSGYSFATIFLFIIIFIIIVILIIFIFRFLFGKTTPGDLNTMCKNNSECKTGLVCDTSASVPICKIPLGSKCTNISQCVTGANYCNSDTNFICAKDRNIAQLGGTCSANIGCQPGLVCDPSTYICKVPINGTCKNNSECIGNGTCVDGICVSPVTMPSKLGEGCSSTRGCDVGLVCDLGTLTCRIPQQSLNPNQNQNQACGRTNTNLNQGCNNNINTNLNQGYNNINTNLNQGCNNTNTNQSCNKTNTNLNQEYNNTNLNQGYNYNQAYNNTNLNQAYNNTNLNQGYNNTNLNQGYNNTNQSCNNKNLFETCSANSDCQSGYCMKSSYYHLSNTSALQNNSSPDLYGETLIPLLTNADPVSHKNIVVDPTTEDLIILKEDGSLTRITCDGNVVAVQHNCRFTDIGIIGNQIYGISNGQLGIVGLMNGGSFTQVDWAPNGLTEIKSHSPSGHKFELSTNSNIYTFEGQNQTQNRTTMENIKRTFNSGSTVLNINRNTNQATIENTNYRYKNVVDGVVMDNGKLITVNPTQSKYVQHVKMVNGEPFYLVKNMCIDPSKSLPTIKL